MRHVEITEDESRERQQTWYGYFMRRLSATSTRRCLDMQPSMGCRKRSRPLIT